MKKIVMLAIAAMLFGCTIPAVQPEPPKTEPPKIVSSSGFIFIPKKVEDSKAERGSFVDETGKIRWLPVRINGIEGSRLMLFPQPRQAVKREEN